MRKTVKIVAYLLTTLIFVFIYLSLVDTFTQSVPAQEAKHKEEKFD